ncbi:phosphatidate cytidylyltransferase [Paenarthrobacter sp. CM16]|jgi:phosphatidate cytidylyltransferase|uniref:phosphatidate cytidylyltransferase n=1 Tax=Paenarthrobacter sp. CM16 TaxID=2738447 RepID=UPI001553BD71|nr:phosphatidate cytidylyltransferase [Paenarthrobacter sp. CM16]NQD86426.1 phosphatidate cytidylyltransferase [Paenarthrobacter sp. CM16]
MNQAEPAPAGRVPTRDSPQRSRRVRTNPTPKAGRNLPAAIGVGLAMLLAVLGGLLFLPLGFVLLTTAFAVLGVWEVFRALEAQGTRMPIIPVMVGSLVMPVSAYFGGLEGLLFTLTASSVAVLLWRSIESAAGAPRSVFAGVFTLAWIPFLISFASLSLHTAGGPTPVGFWPDGIPEGAWQIASMLLLVVSNDTFGYIVGASFGKHPMAPKISPKKSWEGFAGSVGGAMLIGVLACIFLLDKPWWVGLILAVGMVAAATAGDLAESMVKRELGVKDMSSILPGHGGVMDRLDSIVFAAPVAYVLFALLSGV